LACLASGATDLLDFGASALAPPRLSGGKPDLADRLAIIRLRQLIDGSTNAGWPA
jgi:hypothetical protein